MASSLNRVMRSLNRRVLNPMVLTWAGHGSFFVGAIHHVGRKSGRAYTTPITVQPIQDGFLLPLPYGEDTDWCRNVAATGHATLEFKGAMVPVAKPEVLDVRDARSMSGARVVRMWDLFRIRRCLLVKRDNT